MWVVIWPIPDLKAGTTGKIAGKVMDAATGEAIVGANVIIPAQIVGDKEIKLETPLGAITDVEGYFFILNVKPGQYVVRVSFIGYQPMVKQPIAVTVDRTTTVDFRLTQQAIKGGEVVVTAQREMIMKDQTSASAKVSGEDIKTLPVENFSEVLQLQAGVTTGLGGGIHIRGGRSSEIQYYVDGIAVTNPLSNSLAIPIENNAIQELEVISGTFNAEYGQAMSGIVNIVTRDGTDQFTGSLSAYMGDFLSSHSDVFIGIDAFKPTAQQYYEFSLSGPTLVKKLNFFTSGRVTHQDNWLYGRRVYSFSDSSNFSSPDPNDWYIERTGDSALVSMHPYQSYSGQVKFTYSPWSSVNISYNLIANASEGKNYSHYYKFNPDAVPTIYSKAHNNLLKWTHVINPRLFYSIHLAYYYSDTKSYVFKNPMDSRYRSIYRSGAPPQFIFSTGGVVPGHYYQTSRTFAGRSDLTYQINKANLVKIGVEGRFHELDYEYFNIDVNPFRYGDMNPRIPPLTSLDHNQYHRKPVEMAAYIQDKIEIQDLIVNVGVRFDYFNAHAQVPTDLRDPANKLYPRPYSEAYRDAKAKTQFSPRLGLAFPITDRGVIHASYGQFFQIPEFSRLYENPEFEVAGTLGSFLGNADLEPQRTDMYEIGLQQQLAEFIAVDVTGFYRDVRHLLGTQLFQTYQGDIVYGRYINTDYGAVRGVTLSAEARVPSIGLSAGFDYTYQNAKGIASDPKQAFFDAQGKNESQAILLPLDWDLRHTANGFVNLVQKTWGGSIILRMNSGYPFTPPDPSVQRKSTIFELRNQGRYKGDLFLDLRAFKRYKIHKLWIETFVKIDNVLDTMRRDLFPEVDPRDEQAHRQNGLDRFNSLKDYRLNPALQPVPREIKFGVKLDF